MFRAAVSLFFCSLLTACSLFTEPSQNDRLDDARHVDLFDQVEYFIGEDPDELVVVYDPVDGHPIRITADDEYFIESRNLLSMLTVLRTTG